MAGKSRNLGKIETLLQFMETATLMQDEKQEFLASTISTVQDLQDDGKVQRTLIVIWLEDK